MRGTGRKIEPSAEENTRAKVTDTDKELVGIIVAALASEHCPPTQRELAERLKVSRSRIRERLDKLARLGVVLRPSHGKARNIDVNMAMAARHGINCN